MKKWWEACRKHQGKILSLLAAVLVLVGTIWIYGGFGTSALEPDSQTAQSVLDQKNGSNQDGSSFTLGSTGQDSPNGSERDNRDDYHTSSLNPAQQGANPQGDSKAEDKPHIDETKGEEESANVSHEDPVKKDETKSDSAADQSPSAGGNKPSTQEENTSEKNTSGKSTGSTESSVSESHSGGQTKEKHNGTSEPKGTPHQAGNSPDSEIKAAGTDTVLLTIIGSPDVGTILDATEVKIEQASSVLDILKKATRKAKMQMEYSGSGATAYIQGIDNLYEFDKGPGSGWMYSVNGKYPNKSAGVWSITAGDDIRWLYTEDLGKDLGAGIEDGLWDGKD